VLRYGHAVFGCSVSLICIPFIIRELNMKIFHVCIPVGLGQYAGGGYRRILRVSSHDTSMGRSFIGNEPVAVDQQQPRPFP